ncbi:Uncharacterised protein g3102 [Pycnogonum litorale]
MPLIQSTTAMDYYGDNEMSVSEMRAVIMRLTHQLMVAKTTIGQLRTEKLQLEAKCEVAAKRFERDVCQKDLEISQIRKSNDRELRKLASQVLLLEGQFREEQRDIERELERKDNVIRGQRNVIKRLLNRDVEKNERATTSAVVCRKCRGCRVDKTNEDDDCKKTMRGIATVDDKTNCRKVRDRTNLRLNELPSINEEEFDKGHAVHSRKQNGCVVDIGTSIVAPFRFGNARRSRLVAVNAI